MPQLGRSYERAWRHLADTRGSHDAARVFKVVLVAALERGIEETGRVLEAAMNAARSPLLDLRQEPTPQSVTVPDRLAGHQVPASPLAVYDALGRAS
ncbi:MAG: hypothetical protein JXX28_14350 [Deltaproteobacteria bacterium]|nr:hypothetical protein [Deltaproteobacteria bacterium]